MILCTGCGTKNPDDARSCATCGRKLQSRWAAPPQQNGANGGPGGAEGGGSEPVWQLMEPILRGFDEKAAQLMRSAVETWVYGLLLIAAGLATAFTQEWWWLAGGVGLLAMLAWARGI